MIRRLTRCRVISRLGAGTDKIDIAEATRQGIVVANVPDFCTNEQAEHTFALLLAWARRLPFMFDAMRRGQWTARNHPGVHRVAGQTLGLLGFGASAQAVAARAAAFGMRVIAWTRNPAKYAAIAKRERSDAGPTGANAGRVRFCFDPFAARPRRREACSTRRGSP